MQLQLDQKVNVMVITASFILGVAAEFPWLRVSLAPEFNSSNNAVIALDMTLQLNDPNNLKAGQPLLKFDLNHGETPTLRYDNDALSAADDNGVLSLSHTDSNDTNVQRTWSASRDSVGEIVVRFRAEPRETNSSTPSGPRIDLRNDQGGVIGMAEGFIPYPPGDREWNVTVHWNIPEPAPADIRFASSLGDQQNSSTIGTPSRILAKSYFAIGLLQRWPPWNVSASYHTTQAMERDFALYWIGSLPYNPNRVGGIIEEMFLSISEFFGDYESPFRVFWRYVWTGYGGAGGYQSFLLERSDGTEEELSEDALTNLVSHETIHEYALMYPTRQYDLWYREGVANYYAVMAPFYGGALDRQSFIRWLNNNAQAYYTSSTLGLDWQYIVEHYWEGLDIVKSPYNRGFIYLAYVQGLVSAATNEEKSLDDIVLELYRRFIAGEKCQTEEFVEVLGNIIGKDPAEKSFSQMKNGTLIVPPTNSLAKFGLKMVRRDAERFEPGFVVSSNRVTSLVKGSRAEEAGLEEGDQVVSTWALWGAGDSLDNMMQVVIVRDGQEHVIKYWPRSYEKVENWMWVEG